MRATAEALRPIPRTETTSPFRVVTVPSTDIIPFPTVEQNPLNRPDYRSLGIKAPEERSFSPTTLNTSHHELQHSHVIRRLGYGEKLARAEISKKKIDDGISYGRTIIAGELPHVDMIIALAAGSIHTPEGNARGTDMDEKMANELIAQHGGISWEKAKEKARDYILELTDDERMIAARIVDSMKIVDGSLFDSIIKVAKWEAINARDLALKLPERQETEEEQEATIPLAAGEYTILETLPSGEPKVRYVLIDEDGDEHPWLPKRREVTVFTRPRRKLRFAA